MVRIAALPTQIDSRPFRTSEAKRLGVSPGRLRAGDLSRPVRGVRLPAGADSLKQRCLALLEHRPERLAFSHSTAAQLLGAPLPRRLEGIGEFHLSVPAGGRAPQIIGIHSHTLARWKTTTVDGVPITSPEQTWLDLVPRLDREASVAMADYLVSGRSPWTTRDMLAEVVAASPGRRGVKQARMQLESVRAGVDSPGETRLRLVLTDAGLPEPAVNFTLLGRRGETLARADLAYPVAQVALEYEGDVHRVDREVWMKDLARRERVEDAGWRMIRVTAADLHTPAALVARVRKLLAKREKSWV
jgi:hypothetical protein